MKVAIGEKIRELRRRDGRTQEDLAEALGVTCQAVSRWEASGGYPDMEVLPAIANYFGVNIDTLFGFESDRDRKIEQIIARVDAYGLKGRADDNWVEDCLGILREGLALYPQEERLLIKLADTLSEAGWRRHCEWLYYDEEGYIRHDYDRHRKNEYWAEAVKICEKLAASAKDNQIVTKALSILVLLYRNFGENEKAVSCAGRMPELKDCRELLLAAACDGREEAKYIGDALLKMADKFAEQLVYGLITSIHHYDSDMPIEKVKGAISVFHLLCDDGNFGRCNSRLISLYLYLSRLQWERGYRDQAFESLDLALYHARQLDALDDGREHAFTAPLVSGVTFRFEIHELDEAGTVASQLPEDWPFWCNPDCSQTAKEIKADPRWAQWVARTKE